MANIRNFKKDVDYITSELIIECFTYDLLFPDKNKEELTSLISDTVKFREQLFNQINEVKRTSTVPVKSQFKKIRNTMEEQVTGFVDRLSKLEQ